MTTFWERTVHSDNRAFSLSICILSGTRNFSFCNKKVPAENFGTIWILVIIFDRSNITPTKSIRRKWKIRPMELSGFMLWSNLMYACVMNCKVMILCDICLPYATAQCGLVTDNVRYRIAHSSVWRRFHINVIYVTLRLVTIACWKTHVTNFRNNGAVVSISAKLQYNFLALFASSFRVTEED